MKILQYRALPLLLVFLSMQSKCSGWRYFLRRSAVDKEIVVPDMETGKRDTRIASIQDRLQDMFEISFKDEAIVDRGLQTLQALQSKNDYCFKAATKSLEKGCQSLTIKQEKKIQYALQLTLCELATASIPIPLICREAAQGGDVDAEDCISRLANIPQTWTSYSGYFRDAELMCQALRYRLDRERSITLITELLEQLHRNISVHQLRHFQLLREQQRSLMEWRREEISTLEAIRQSQSDLWILFENHVNDAQTRTTREIFNLMDMVVSIQQAAETVLETQEQLQQDIVDWSKEQLDDLGVYFKESTREVFEEASLQLQMLQEGIRESYFTQRRTLDDLLHMQIIQTNVTGDLTKLSFQVKDSMHQMLNETVLLVDVLKYHIGDVRAQLNGLSDAIQRASSIFNHLGGSMITLIGVLAMIMIVIHPVYSILRIIFRQHLHLSQSSIKLSVLVSFAILAAVKYASHLHMLLWSRELRGQEFPVPECKDDILYRLTEYLHKTILVVGVVIQAILKRRGRRIDQSIAATLEGAYQKTAQEHHRGLQDRIITIDPIKHRLSNVKDEGRKGDDEFVKRLQILYDILL
ncbi:hypothetical protein VTP01DRAFT_9748 [Rhizomucor pusillus]|uniref:uncharacterized protein n=1 Tax=Rhizomucor pusillus TaxID=4840 RepID=UPI0037422996